MHEARLTHRAAGTGQEREVGERGEHRLAAVRTLGDVIGDTPPRPFLAGLATTACEVRSQAGERYRGILRHAAVRCDERALLAATKLPAEPNDADLLETIREHIYVDTRRGDPLSALASASGVHPRACDVVAAGHRGVARWNAQDVCLRT